MKRIIVAIDGYSSCGKSTIAKALAQYADYTYIDTGAMYRAVALYLSENLSLNRLDVEIENLEELLDDIQIAFVSVDGSQHLFLNGVDVEDRIRTLAIGNLASQVSTNAIVRRCMVAQQQQMGIEKGIVMDGRDIGTVVFPGAELKIFLTASPKVRAQRRFLELQAKGKSPVFEEVLADVNERDYRDTHRAESPLRQAEDAIVVDNSEMTPEEQLQHVIALFNSAISK